MASDFSSLAGGPIFLFDGLDAPWSTGIAEGAFVIHDVHYYVFWSSYSSNGYCCGYSKASSLAGPYTHSMRPVLSSDAGHASTFRLNGDGDRMLAYHQPNGVDVDVDVERAHFSPLHLENGEWRVDDVEPAVSWYAWVAIISITAASIAVILLINVQYSRGQKWLDDSIKA
jgi:hypothetical protein